METEKFYVFFIGNSRDGKTNEWRFTCKKCNTQFFPPTTILAKQEIKCTKCGETETVNYNKL